MEKWSAQKNQRGSFVKATTVASNVVVVQRKNQFANDAFGKHTPDRSSLMWTIHTGFIKQNKWFV